MRGRHSEFNPERAEQFLKRLKGTEGKIGLAARSLGISVQTVSDWRKHNGEFAAKCEAVLREAKAR